MNLGCSLSTFSAARIWLHILLLFMLLVNWSNCSYFDAIYRSMLPKQWTSSSSSSSSFPSGRSGHNRYLSMQSRPINFANLRQSNKFNGNKLIFAPNDDSHPSSRLLFGAAERQSSSILDHQSLNLDQSSYEQRPAKTPQSSTPAPASGGGGCNCNPIIKTKYIAIEIPKVVRIPGETNPQQPPSTEAAQPTSPAPPPTSPSPTYASDSEAGSSGKRSHNDGSMSKTRIITIREIPNAVSKTLLVNSYEGHAYETSSRSSVSGTLTLGERERETEKVQPTYSPASVRQPSRVQQPGEQALSTYVGFEDY